MQRLNMLHIEVHRLRYEPVAVSLRFQVFTLYRYASFVGGSTHFLFAGSELYRTNSTSVDRGLSITLLVQIQIVPV